MMKFARKCHECGRTGTPNDWESGAWLDLTRPCQDCEMPKSVFEVVDSNQIDWNFGLTYGGVTFHSQNDFWEWQNALLIDQDITEMGNKFVMG